MQNQLTTLPYLHFLLQCLLDELSSPGQREVLFVAHHKDSGHSTLHHPITQDIVQEPRGKELVLAILLSVMKLFSIAEVYVLGLLLFIIAEVHTIRLCQEL